jgi:hypothetical protein
MHGSCYECYAVLMLLLLPPCTAKCPEYRALASGLHCLLQ